MLNASITASIIATTTIVIPTGSHRGASTNHHDQVITPVSLSVINTRVSKLKNPTDFIVMQINS